MAQFKNITIELKNYYYNGTNKINVYSILSNGENVWDITSHKTTVNDLFYKLNYAKYYFSLDDVTKIFNTINK